MGARTQTVMVFEEIADVQIMLEQLRLIFGLNDLVHEHRDRKILRLKDRSRIGRAHV